TFWMPQKSRFFILTGNHQPTAEALYNPRIFYWDPDRLLPQGVPCPNCGIKLKRHEYTRPRRVVDFQNCFYLIGQRYLCPHCRNPKSQKKTVTFNSWDSRIMEKLPRELRDEFPAYLSHRGAIAKPVFEIMRTSFQYGLGSKQFSNSLQVLHRLYFDQIHCQYLDGALSWIKTHGQRELFTAFSSFDDSNGYGGFTPSSQWLGMMYNHYIEEHRVAMDQQAAMKSLRVGQMDHSYKVTKQIMKINGESVFGATLTVANQDGEARLLAFVATSSHSDFKTALQKVQQNLNIYGLQQPEFMFVDNVAADKNLLESVFPSLTKDVVPVNKHADKAVYNLPDNVQISISYSVLQITDAISGILHDLNSGNSNEKLVVGFDMEWNVNRNTPGQQPTAIIQIAYKQTVHILQVAHFASRLPAVLTSFLSNPQILKAGKGVEGDLKRLSSECDLQFTGALDLAKLAKELQVISDARMGLADLCARVLGRRL
ncbi:hypothetical protein C8F01DRAFT_951498, partial [Mycena amicta]